MENIAEVIYDGTLIMYGDYTITTIDEDGKITTTNYSLEEIKSANRESYEQE